MIQKYYAKEGFVWKSKRENWIGTEVLILGSNDDITNYEQIPVPVEEAVDESDT